MTRRSLRPQLNQIRTWVRQGRTDAWIAHQLEVTVQQIQGFKRENGLVPDVNGEAATDFDDEIDLRAEDDALIAKELEAEAERAAAEAEVRAAEAPRAGGGGRRRGRRRGGRRRGARAAPPPRATRRNRANPSPGWSQHARGHVRSRRGGLRPLARSRGQGRPHLRRALGRTPAGRGHDRGERDRHPARRPRRGRRRRGLTASRRRPRATARGSTRRCGAARTAGPSTSSRSPGARRCWSSGCRGSGT